jgi:hypothetical protein
MSRARDTCLHVPVFLHVTFILPISILTFTSNLRSALDLILLLFFSSSSLVFGLGGGCSVRISGWTLAILTHVLRGFIQYLRTNFKIVPQ